MTEQLSHVPLEEGNSMGTQIKPLLHFPLGIPSPGRP